MRWTLILFSAFLTACANTGSSRNLCHVDKIKYEQAVGIVQEYVERHLDSDEVYHTISALYEDGETCFLYFYPHSREEGRYVIHGDGGVVYSASEKKVIEHFWWKH